jgi:hypothetical protein
MIQCVKESGAAAAAAAAAYAPSASARSSNVKPKLLLQRQYPQLLRVQGFIFVPACAGAGRDQRGRGGGRPQVAHLRAKMKRGVE